MVIKEAIWDTRAKWRDIGCKLGLKAGDIDSIHDHEDGECLHIVLSHWMHTGRATIHELLKALESKIIDCSDIVREIVSLKGENQVKIGLFADGATEKSKYYYSSLRNCSKW